MEFDLFLVGKELLRRKIYLFGILYYNILALCLASMKAALKMWGLFDCRLNKSDGVPFEGIWNVVLIINESDIVHNESVVGFGAACEYSLVVSSRLLGLLPRLVFRG